jgi:hypothetical protein
VKDRTQREEREQLLIPRDKTERRERKEKKKREQKGVRRKQSRRKIGKGRREEEGQETKNLISLFSEAPAYNLTLLVASSDEVREQYEVLMENIILLKKVSARVRCIRSRCTIGSRCTREKMY